MNPLLGLPGDTLLRKAVSLFARIYELSLASEFGVRSHELFLPLCYNVYWLHLVQVLCRQWVHEYIYPIVTRILCCVHVFPDPQDHLIFPLPPSLLSLNLGVGWNRCLFCDRACHWNVFPTFWAVARFCINHCPPHNETSLMRSESSIVCTVMQFGGKFDTMSILQSNHSRFTSRAHELPYCLFFARFTLPGMCFLLQSRP